MCRMKDGTEKCDVMSMDDVEAIRKRSQAGNNGPWVTDYAEMAKKTIFRRLSKWLPLSPEIRSAAENDDDVIDIEPQNVRRVNSTDSEGLANALEDMLAKSSADQQHVAAIEDQQPQVLDTTVVDDREKIPVQQQHRETAAPKGRKASPADALVAESLEAADEKQLDDIVKRAGSLETEQQRMKVYLACDARKKELQKST